MLAGGPGSEKRSAAVQSQIRTGLAPQDELRQWLRSLDKGIGALLKYAEALETHFEGSLVQIQACLVDGSDAMTSALSCVDEMFFRRARYTKIGERLLLRKGIKKLAGLAT